jgi:HTH-type transcriptional regulator / antitoxin HigA
MATERQAVSDLPIPPGELLSETLESMNLTQAELARRMGRPAQAINEIVRGTKEITAETAIQLERVVSVPANIWLGLEAEYRHTKALIEDRQRLDAELPLVKKFPCAEMIRLGWIPEGQHRVSALLNYFGVSSLLVVREAEGAAYQLSRSLEAEPGALAAWLRKGVLDAQHIATKPFSEVRLRQFLPDVRAFITLAPEQFEQRLKDSLAECGVGLVLLPHLRKTHAHGATRWLTPEKALIQLSLRGKWADMFWFTLFHEIGHLLLHGRRDVFIESTEVDTTGDQAEREADAFARDQLISPEAYREFIAAHPRPTRAAVRTFALRQGIAPGIVVGRLHHEGRLFQSAFNDLRVRYDWTTNNNGGTVDDN